PCPVGGPGPAAGARAADVPQAGFERLGGSLHFGGIVQGETMMKGKLALVTGSTSGIGLGIARALARQGADLVINGFGDPDEIERLRVELAGTHGVRVDYEAADLARPADIEALFARLEARGASVDILVNNAGIQHVAPVERFPADRWDAVIAINLSAAFHAIRCALPPMQ